MKYTLNFSLRVDRNGSSVIYDSEAFAEKPIMISLPETIKIIECFIENFEKLGIIENPDKVDTTEKPNSLRGLSGTAYICKSKELGKDILDNFCVQLTEYLQKCCSNISMNSLLSDKISLDIAGLVEVIEIRNYLSKYTGSNKKQYQDGYLYIMS